jgi:hypothetical protein
MVCAAASADKSTKANMGKVTFSKRMVMRKGWISECSEWMVWIRLIQLFCQLLYQLGE